MVILRVCHSVWLQWTSWGLQSIAHSQGFGVCSTLFYAVTGRAFGVLRVSILRVSMSGLQ